MNTREAWLSASKIFRWIFSLGGIGLCVILVASGQWSSALWVLSFVGLLGARPFLELVMRGGEETSRETYGGTQRLEILQIAVLSVGFTILGIAILLGLVGSHRYLGLMAFVAAGSFGYMVVLGLRKLKVEAGKTRTDQAARKTVEDEPPR